jgi:hypothetical protein
MIIKFSTFVDNGPLNSPVDYRGHAAIGSKGAVAVEAEECSNIGVDSMFLYPT